MRIKISEYAIIYTLGALGYCCIELMWRGYTHWTMTVTGGVCFVFIYMTTRSLKNSSILKKGIICAAEITATELAVGWVVNVMLGWAVWDYSDRILSFMGQICPSFSLLWFILSIPLIFLSETMQRTVFYESQQTKKQRKSAA